MHVLAGRLADHPFDEIDAEHRFGDRMLDLQAGVDLEEVEFLARGIVDELDRAGRAIVRPRGRDRPPPRAGGSATVVGEAGRRGLLDHLLVAPLQRAIAFAERDHLALAVAEDLHLDMAGVGDEALEIDAGVAEAGARGALHAVEGGSQRCRHRRRAACRCRRRRRWSSASPDSRWSRPRRAPPRASGSRPVPGSSGTPLGLGQFARRVLQAEGRDVLGRRADEGDAFGREPLGRSRYSRERKP